MDLPQLAPDRVRRWEIYAAARPVFERHGFRNATISELAWASGLQPPSLYHYFPSKAAFALFPLSADNGLCATWHAEADRLPSDPWVRLDALIDFVSTHIDSIRVALSLAREMSDNRLLDRVARAAVSQARDDFRSLAYSLGDGIGPERADDLFQAVATMAAGSVPGVERDPAALRRQLGDAARGWLASLKIAPPATGEAPRASA